MNRLEIFYYFLYFILNFLSFILEIFFNYKLLISIPISFQFKQIFVSSLSIFFLYLTRNKPGYVEKDKEKLETKSYINTNVESSPIVQLNLMPNNGCEICQIKKLPLRSLHCPKCKKCVKGFDHHFWILAGCIGENNRFSFFLFLLFQNISNIMSLYGILKILNNQDNEYLTYILIFLFSIFCLIEILFFWILIYHIYLLISNQSTYELFNEEKCPYLSIFILERQKLLAQRGIVIINNSKPRPFDKGIINNICLYFNKMFNSEKSINWEELYFNNLRTNQVKLNCGDKEVFNSIK